MHSSPPWYVLTGGPCAGKTTTLNEIARRGHPILAEGARLEIEEGLARGETLDQIRSGDWLQRVVRRQFGMEQAVSRDETFFFDRGVPDSLGYYRFLGVEPDQILLDAVKRSTYRKVFLLELTDFVRDGARNETPEEAERIQQLLYEAYAGLGYEIVDVPIMPIPDRADFILSHL